MLNKLKERHETEVGGGVGAFEGKKGFVSWVGGSCNRQWVTFNGYFTNFFIKNSPNRKFDYHYDIVKLFPFELIYRMQNFEQKDMRQTLGGIEEYFGCIVWCALAPLSLLLE